MHIIHGVQQIAACVDTQCTRQLMPYTQVYARLSKETLKVLRLSKLSHPSMHIVIICPHLAVYLLCYLPPPLRRKISGTPAEIYLASALVSPLTLPDPFTQALHR